MVKEEIILRLNRVLNTTGLKYKFKREELTRYMEDYDIEEALRTGILKKSIHSSYQIDYDNYFTRLLGILGLRNPIYDGLIDVELRSASIAVNKHLQLKLYLANIISSSTIEDILNEDDFVIPLLLTSRVEADKFRTSEEYENLRNYLSSGVVRNLQILSLFVPVLPLPERSTELRYYREALKKIESFLNEISTEIDSSLDEVSFIIKHRDLVISKTLASFLYLYKGLYYAHTIRFRSKARNPDYWFEYILKTLLTKFLVEHHRFLKEVADYLYNEYRVGGKCEEDIAVPILQDGKIGIIIVDAKLWKDDVCREIKNNTEKLLQDPEIVKKYECGKRQKKPKESLMKYLWYINRKSSKLLKLESILAGTLGRNADYYHLLIVQPDEPDRDCCQTLLELQEELIKVRGEDFRTAYSDIAIISLNNLWRCISNSTDISSCLTSS